MQKLCHLSSFNCDKHLFAPYFAGNNMLATTQLHFRTHKLHFNQ